MSTLLRRTGNVYDMANGDLRPPATGHRVLVLKAGGIVSAASTGATLTLHTGHSFEVGSKIMLGSDTATFSGIYTVASTTSTTITMSGGTYATSVGDRVLQLGPDSGTSTPNWDGSTVSIYSTPDTTTAITNEQATVDSGGEYGYWHNGQSDLWEVVLSPLGAVSGINVDAYQREGSYLGTGVYHVQDYGAKGDGVTDDSAAIQAAIDAAEANGSGVVLFGDGTFVHNTGLTLESSGVELVGNGVQSTILKPGTAMTNQLTLGTTGSPIFRWAVRNMRFNDPSSNATRGLYLNYAREGLIEDVMFYQGYTNAAVYFAGTASAGSWINRVNRLLCTSTAGDGIYFGLQSNNIMLSDCFFTSCTGSHIKVNNANGIKIVQCGFERAGSGFEIYVSGFEAGPYTNSLTITNSYFELETANAAARAVLIDESGGVTAAEHEAFAFKDNYVYGSTTAAYGLEFNAANGFVKGEVSGNQFHGLVTAAVKCTTANDAVLVMGTRALTGFGTGSTLPLLDNNSSTGKGVSVEVGNGGKVVWNGQSMFGQVSTVGGSGFPIGTETVAIWGTAPLTVNRDVNSISSSWGISFGAKDSGSALQQYGALAVVIDDNTAASEDGAISLRPCVAGTLTEMAEVDAAGLRSVGAIRGGSVDVNITGNDNVTTAGRHLINLTNVSGTNTITLSAPSSVDGQHLYLRCAALTAGTFTLADSGNVALSAAWAPDAGDTLSLVANGVVWYETARSAN